MPTTVSQLFAGPERAASRATGAFRGVRALLYLAFAATGLGCALPGVLLPSLLAQRHWADVQGGRLFLLVALGCALGPLVVTLFAERAAPAGCLLLTLSAAGWSMRNSPILPLGVLWGLGLGVTMTGISLLSQRLVADGAVELTRLNFLWSVGALLCPLAASHALSAKGPGAVLRGVALGFGALCCGLLLLLPGALRNVSVLPAAQPAARHTSVWRLGFWDLRGIPLRLLLAAALSTGIEASGGAWLATLATRLQHRPDHAPLLLMAVAAPSCFWAGLLSSRALSWSGRTSWHGKAFLRAMLVLVAAAAGSLLLPTGGRLLLLSSFALGFGLGPLYPELLARVLRFRHTSLVFFVAGVCSAVLPWLTGVLSSHTSSLRLGLLVPALGALLMLGSGWSVPERETR